MIVKKVSRFYCEHCRKGGFKRALMERHERHCYRNPGRIPYEGELSYSGQMGRLVNFGTSENLPDGMNWIEWVWHDKMPAWWPGKPGMIYHEGQWWPVPGYKMTFPTGAHGCAGGPAPEDSWPEIGGSEDIAGPRIPARMRWDHWAGPLIEKLNGQIIDRILRGSSTVPDEFSGMIEDFSCAR